MELLDKNSIFKHLDDVTTRLISSLDVMNVIPSTNDYLLQRIPEGLRRGSVCVAEGQSAGKGRLGRKWHSPLGSNIYLSFYWEFDRRAQDLSGLSLVVGVAIMEALTRIAPLPKNVGIKWPNDIWHNDAKLGGILIEMHRNQGIVIGVGLNVSMPIDEVDGRAVTDLERLFGKTPSRNQLIAFCLQSMIHSMIQFEKEGLSFFSSLWSHYDLLNGKSIELSTVDLSEEGVAKGINERGELFVQIGQTLKTIRSGEIRVRPKTTCMND